MPQLLNVFTTFLQIIDELNSFGVTHVLCCTGRTQGGNFKTIEYLEGGADKAYENLRDNLYCPLVLAHISQTLGLHYSYIGTGYLFAYDEAHPIGGKGFLDDGKSMLKIHDFINPIFFFFFNCVLQKN